MCGATHSQRMVRLSISRYLRRSNLVLMQSRRSLTVPERKQYLKSVTCLFEKAPIAKRYFPPVTNRYEDFVALHVNATAGGRPLNRNMARHNMSLPETGVHFNGVFLPWHRYFLWMYENTLRDECGWTMGQPCEYPGAISWKKRS
jgi:tyrosinase